MVRGSKRNPYIRGNSLLLFSPRKTKEEGKEGGRTRRKAGVHLPLEGAQKRNDAKGAQKERIPTPFEGLFPINKREEGWIR